MKKYVAHVRIELEAEDLEQARTQVGYFTASAGDTVSRLKHAVRFAPTDPAGFDCEYRDWVQEVTS